jgi:hypothetical protein
MYAALDNNLKKEMCRVEYLIKLNKGVFVVDFLFIELIQWLYLECYKVKFKIFQKQIQ